MAVVNNDHFAHAPIGAGIGDEAVTRCKDRLAAWGGNIDSFVKFTQAGKRRLAVSESGRYPPIGGPYGRGRGQQTALVFQIVQQRNEPLTLGHGGLINLFELCVHFTQ
jgi:hypothetical protein